MSQRYRTDRNLIDLAARSIQCDGVAVDVEAKVFDLIELLIVHRERALTKREIGDALWPQRAVTDAALSQLLRKARRALGDDGDAQKLIRTVHGRGLQWVAALREDDDASSEQPAAPAPSPEPPPAPASDPGLVAPSTAVAPSKARFWRIASALLGLVLLLGAFGYGIWQRAQPAVAASADSAVRIVVLPTVDDSAEAELAWVPRGLMGLIGGVISSAGEIETATLPADLAATDSLDAAGLKHVHDAVAATHVVSTRLRKLGPLYELDLRLQATRSAADRTETLHGSTPAELAVDAAQRISRWLRQSAPSPEIALQSGSRDPFLAEVYARGLDAQLRGDQVGAMKYFDIALDHDSDALWPRLQLARAQAASGQLDASGVNLDRVIAAATAASATPLRIIALQQLAMLQFQRGDMKAASQQLDRALADLPAGPSLLRVDLLTAYGSIDDERGELVQARQRFDTALQQVRMIGDRRREARVLINMAGVENSSGDAVAAIARLRSGLDAARAAGDVALEGAALGNLGAAEANAGNLLDAASLLGQALRIARQRSDAQATAFTSSVLAWILGVFDRSDSARQLAEQTLRIGQRDKSTYWQAEAQVALGNLAAQRKDWPAAAQAMTLARELYEAGGQSRNGAQIVGEAVSIATAAKDRAAVHANADRYAELMQRNPDDRVLASRWPLISAQCRHIDGDPRTAMDELDRYIAAGANPPGPAFHSALLQLGRWQDQAGDAEALLELSSRPYWPKELPEALQLRGDALRRLGRHEQADAVAEQVRRLRQSPQLDLDPALTSAE